MNDVDPARADEPVMGTFNASSAIDDVTSELVPDNDRRVLWGVPMISVTGNLQPIEAFHNMPAHAPRCGQGLELGA